MARKKDPARAAVVDKRRAQFGQAVYEARSSRGWSQEYLGNLLGVSQAAITAWESALNVPDADGVFDAERALGLRAGELSQHLGYLPLNAAGVRIPKPDVPNAIISDPKLGDTEKRMLLAAYRSVARSE